MNGREGRALALVGLRCSGKTSVGRELARLLGRRFVDLDDELLNAWRRSPERRTALAPASPAHAGELLVLLGEPAFRALESRTLRSVLSGEEPIVLATGGGVAELAENRAELGRRAFVVWMRVDLPVLQARLAADPVFRPALLGADPAGELPELARRRASFYGEVADLALDCGQESPEHLAGRLAEVIRREGAPEGPPGSGG